MDIAVRRILGSGDRTAAFRHAQQHELWKGVVIRGFAQGQDSRGDAALFPPFFLRHLVLSVYCFTD